MSDATIKKSTIARAYGMAGRRMVRPAFRTLDLVAPALAARWALRIWLTPPKRRRGRSGAPELPPGNRFVVSSSEAGGSVVVAEAWGEGPTTYLLHGWGGWRGQLAGLVAALVAAGQRVVALDAPGHGESVPGPLGGRRTTLTHIAEALAAAVAVGGPAHAIVGHSGGASAVALAVREGLAADRLVFLAPMADPVPYLDPFGHVLGFGARTRVRFRRRLEHAARRDMAAFDVPGWAATAGPGELPPLLVVHDRGDREVRYRDGQAIAGAWPGATLRTVEGLGHRRIVNDAGVIDAVVSFVAAPVAEVRVATVAGSTGRR
jgi:pimeloyl-ACP methyl ester carboxylesterase